jgi:hypothetical protein
VSFAARTAMIRPASALVRRKLVDTITIPACPLPPDTSTSACNRPAEVTKVVCDNRASFAHRQRDHSSVMVRACNALGYLCVIVIVSLIACDVPLAF